ncbi:acyl-CoA Delta-9 desaturase isoform X2 [Pectinophora gossypiella]|nr:acyl-CoA Delta-9 desaturase isoform X2 [Pectinophora gossypiella]XP_049868602.1 acyl-CoA Delta-9 desaturase isoform X2 [Pectinophora gossypiella]
MVQISEATEGPQEGQRVSRSREANWPAVLFFIHIHLLSAYGLWLLFFEVKLMTILLLITLTLFAILGVTTGAHRLWAHRAYKATPALRVFLAFCQTLAGQGPIYDWVRHHRLHHAQFGTNGDPYDHRQGFLYAHILTRMRKLSPHQDKLLEQIDMSDLESDSIVMWQKRLYWILYVVFFLLLPLNAPLEYWDDTVLASLFVVGFLRYGIILHAAWLVESGICVWGLQPGEKYPHDSNSVFILAKTFWPHYHYLIPYDYKSGEFGTYDCGCSTAFIRVWAALGLATDLRTVETPAIQQALADAAKNKRPVKDSIDDAAAKQTLPAEHYLKRG